MVDNEFGWGYVKQVKKMMPQGYPHPGYPNFDINNIRAEHDKVVRQLEIEIESLRTQVKELHEKISQMEIDNSPIMLI
jgi:hypothetical protein